MTWVDCDNALLAVNAASDELGWERYEELLLRVKAELENHRGQPIRLRLKFPAMIRPRTMKLLARIRLELQKFAAENNSYESIAFLTNLHQDILRWLSGVLPNLD